MSEFREGQEIPYGSTTERVEIPRVVDREFNSSVSRIFNNEIHLVEDSQGGEDYIHYLETGRDEISRLGDPKVLEGKRPEDCLIGLYELAYRHGSKEQVAEARGSNEEHITEVYDKLGRMLFPEIQTPTEFRPNETKLLLEDLGIEVPIHFSLKGSEASALDVMKKTFETKAAETRTLLFNAVKHDIYSPDMPRNKSIVEEAKVLFALKVRIDALERQLEEKKQVTEAQAVIEGSSENYSQENESLVPDFKLQTISFPVPLEEATMAELEKGILSYLQKQRSELQALLDKFERGESRQVSNGNDLRLRLEATNMDLDNVSKYIELRKKQSK